MAVRRLLALMLLLAACNDHGSSPAPSANDFFLSSQAWCKAEANGFKLAQDDQVKEIYVFGRDGILRIKAGLTNDLGMPQVDKNQLLKTAETETHAWHADNQHLFLKVGDDDRQASYSVVKRDVDGKSLSCFTMAELDEVRCPCAISSEEK